jgi:arylformamidase
MARPIYRGYDKDALWAQYNNRGMVPAEEVAAIKAEQARRADALRASPVRRELDIQYGWHSRERLDLFLPEARNPPLHVFLHGGYWQMNDKEPFAFVADALVPAGVAVANVEYALCPSVTMAELADQVRRAVAYLWRAAPGHGYDRDNIQLSGHSAGGHLTALMMATDWPAFDPALPRDVIASGLPISGIYDLEPMRLTPLNDACKLDEAAVAALSPMFMAPKCKAPMAVVVGGAESAEFNRQAADFADAWRRHGTQAEVITVPGMNHFTVLDELARPGSAVHRAALRLMRRV